MLQNADLLGKALSTTLPDNVRIYAFLRMPPSKASPNPGTLVQGSRRYRAGTQATSRLSLHNTPVRNFLIMGNVRMFDAIAERPYSRESSMLGYSIALCSRPESRFRVSFTRWNRYVQPHVCTANTPSVIVFRFWSCLQSLSRPPISPCIALK